MADLGKGFRLTLSPDYQKGTWKKWEAIREIISNAIDGEIHTKFPATIMWESESETLVVRNDGARLQGRHLLLGVSDSRGHRDTIGTFGEGLPMALLVFAREGIEVVIDNDDERWRPSIEYSEEYNSEIVFVGTRKIKSRGCFEVRIPDINREYWNMIRSRFLRLTDSVNKVSVSEGEILLDPKNKGMIFNKGVYVTRQDNFEFGYNLRMELNRDRSIIDSWQLRETLPGILSEACSLPDPRVRNKILTMLSEGNESVELSDTYFFRKNELIANSLFATFQKQYGTEAIPVSSMTESRELEFFGKTGVVIPKKILEIIKDKAPNFASIKAELTAGPKTQYSWQDLTIEERAMFKRIMKLTKCQLPVSIVDFWREDLHGLYEEGSIMLSRKILESFEQSLITLVHEISHQHGEDAEHSHEESQLKMMAKIIVELGG